MPQNEFDELLNKYLKGECTSEEESIVLEWHQSLINSSKVEISDNEQRNLEKKVWDKISAGVNDLELKSKSPKVISIDFWKNAMRWSVAASIILIFSAGVFYYYTKQTENAFSKNNNQFEIPKDYNVFKNVEKKSKEIVLPDGSHVILSSNSSISYPTSFNKNTRDVYLLGSGFFNVTHDTAHHFIVHCDHVETEVLGTSFEIKKNDKTNVIEVAVSTGKVAFYEKSKKISANNITQSNSIILKPNQKASYNPINSQFITTLVEEPKLLSTLNHNPDTIRFNYQETPLNKIFAELQAAYGISIKTEQSNLANCHFTGDVTKQDLYKKLEIICQATQSSYELQGINILIKGQGCN
jgi:hypothetical protein